MSKLSRGELQALLQQHQNGGELQVVEEQEPHPQVRPQRARRAPPRHQDLQEAEAAKPKKKRDGPNNPPPLSKKKRRQMERAKGTRLKLCKDRFCDNVQEIVAHSVQEREIKVWWTSGEKSWNDPKKIVGSSGDCDIILDYLHRHQEERDMNKWIDEMMAFQFQVKEQEDEEGRTPQFREIAFCCAVCKCSQDAKDKHPGFCQSSEVSVWHRCCCHNIRGSEVESDWMSPVDIAIEEAMNKCMETQGVKEAPWQFICSRADLKKRAKDAVRKENEILGQLQDENPIDVLNSSQPYLDMCNIYRRHKDTGIRGEAVVLDMFAGVGTGSVVLKRLGVAIKTIIHVDIDMVARHVTRYNHDKTYNSSLEHPDDIDHVFSYLSFEDVEENLDEILENYGPIDVVIGGPPCQDHSLVNAYRQGVKGKGGQYFPRFGELIKKIQAHTEQNSQPVFFLAENVQVTGFENKKAVEQAFGVPPFVADACFFGPCKRLRGYYLNLPVSEIDWESVEAASSATLCLEDGWFCPAIAVNDETASKTQLLKANTFMASLGRIDDERMMKVRVTKDGKYEVGTYSISERERMLGYPEGYVENAVDVLYTEITMALGVQRLDETPWQNILDAKYHCFAGEKYKFEKPNGGPIEPKLRPPTTDQFFNQEQYAKHLIGNAYSIPVVEHLLRPLTKLFQKRSYSGYDYSFCWPTVNEPGEEVGHATDQEMHDSASSPEQAQESNKDGTTETARVRVKTEFV